MTREEKQLLLKDLCARLPYNVVIHCTDNDTDYKCFLTTDILNEILHNIEYYNYKPYLRPMSSMTNEENEEFKSIAGGKMIEGYNFIVRKCTLEYKTIAEIEEWLNTNNFDFRGLIEKDLALEAPEGMYN